MKTPNEIAAPAFKKGISGYSIAEVDEYAKSVKKDYEELYNAFTETEEKLRVIVEGYSELKAKESTVEATIAEAKEISAALITQAKDHYEKTVADAEAKSDEINSAMSASCKETLALYSEMYEEEKQRLIEMEKKAQKFRAYLLGAYKKQLSLLCSTIPSGTGVKEEETKELPSDDDFKAEVTSRFREKVTKISGEEESANAGNSENA